MDRQIVYPGAIPLDTDILSIQRNAMIALGYAMQAVAGTGTFVDGLACTPTSPATLTVNIGQGSVITLASIDATAFGSLAADSADPLMKMGINAVGSTPFTMVAPTTSGQSINYLIEAAFQEADMSPVALPYYNAGNPAQPYTGPSGSGVAQNTVRGQHVQLQMKAGAAATTGTQATPAVDAGWVGLYIVTVNFGQTQITNTSIVTHPLAPFIPAKLPMLRKKLFANLTLYINGTTGNDSNNGLASTTAFASLQGAWNYIVSSLDLNGFAVIVNVANGNYANLSASGTVVGNTQGTAGVQFVGNTGSPTSVAVTGTTVHAVLATGGAVFSVAGMQFTSSGTTPSGPPAGCLVASTGSNLAVSGPITFGACAGYHTWGTQGGTVSTVGQNYTISGGAQVHMFATGGGQVIAGGGTITLSGTPAFSVGFAGAQLLGLAQMLSATFSGSATGPRYSVTTNGVVNTGTGNVNYFPGNSVGATATGGQYA